MTPPEDTPLREENMRLRTALEPFAKYACPEPHVGEPKCHNCIAREALTESKA